MVLFVSETLFKWLCKVKPFIHLATENYKLIIGKQANVRSLRKAKPAVLYATKLQLTWYGSPLETAENFSIVASFLVHMLYVSHMYILNYHTVKWGTRWRTWLRHWAASRMVTVSIHDGVGIFHWSNSSGCTVALGLTQLLTEMSTRNISWGIKASGA
jgi:hypothetical protein